MKNYDTQIAVNYILQAFEKSIFQHGLQDYCYPKYARYEQNGMIKGEYTSFSPLTNLNTIFVDFSNLYFSSPDFIKKISNNFFADVYDRDDISQTEVVNKIYLINHDIAQASYKLFPDRFQEPQAERIQLELLLATTGSNFYKEHKQDTLLEAKSNYAGVIETINYLRANGEDFELSKEIAVQAYNMSLTPNSPFLNVKPNENYNPQEKLEFINSNKLIPYSDNIFFKSYKEWDETCQSRIEQILSETYPEHQGFIPGLFNIYDPKLNFEKAKEVNEEIKKLGFDSEYYNSLNQREKLYLETAIAIEFSDRAINPEAKQNLIKEQESLIDKGILDKNLCSLDYHRGRLQEWEIEKTKNLIQNEHQKGYKNIMVNTGLQNDTSKDHYNKFKSSKNEPNPKDINRDINNGLFG